ncbi:MAG: DUF1826 domain-containing protein [Gammaproteobacteria bacterium]|nr:DUF1826 domain-containing protein [Gammaproteobacteria bacterium]
MSSVISPSQPNIVSENKQVTQELYRRVVQGNSHEVFGDIYDPLTNMAVWQRQLAPSLAQACDELMMVSDNSLQLVMSVTPSNVQAEVEQQLGGFSHASALSQDIALLVEMFCCLFELKRVGLRLTTLDRAMCPRFHVDKVPCRLVTTYSGVGSEWLEQQDVNRTKLGTGNQGLSDQQSGLYEHEQQIGQLASGDVALLKGEKWYNNEGGGLVHRSPQVAQNRRLLLTLDFM